MSRNMTLTGMAGGRPGDMSLTYKPRGWMTLNVLVKGRMTAAHTWNDVLCRSRDIGLRMTTYNEAGG